MKSVIEQTGIKARKAARELALLSERDRNMALESMADALRKNSGVIAEENEKDIVRAEEEGLSDAMIDRLYLNRKKVYEMADGIQQVISLPDPLGRVYDESVRPNGLKVAKVRIPIGVVGIIYESRPNVTSDTAALCIKSGNAVILRGGKEAFNSNLVIARVLSEALEKSGFSPNSVQFVKTTDRAAVLDLLKMSRYIDVIIPRGGEGLIKFVSENSTIPVIKHDAGVCHVYIDEGADFDMARNIAVNSKVQRPGVCNAAETLLIHSSWLDHASELLSALASEGVELRGCERTRKVYPDAKPAVEADWSAEYLSLILAVKIVDSMEEAIDHIERYGSHHTEAIVTSSTERGGKFVAGVDSSAVIVNASTRFNDGGQFGLGAEMGVSTQKLHCRGPMGLEELATYKFFVIGEGQIR